MFKAPIKTIKPRSPRKINVNVRPNCEKCKYSLKENGEMVCKYFKYSSVTFYDNRYRYYMHTTDCRNTADLCGKDGKYFEPKLL